MQRLIPALVATLVLAAAPLLAQNQDPQLAEANAAFEKGYYQEHGLMDLGAAIASYRRAHRLAEKTDRALAGRALLRVAICERERGQEMEARKVLERLLSQYGDIPKLQARADELLSESGATKRALVTYDVEYLVRRPKDHPGPSLALPGDLRREGAGGMLSFDDAPEGVTIDREQLIALILDNIAPDSWANDRNHIEFEGYRMLVVQRPEIHEQIETYLKRLRALRGRLITFEATSAVMEGPLLEQLMASSDAFPTISEQTLDSLRKRSQEGASVRILDELRLSAFNRQRVHLAPTRNFSFLSDYEVNQTGVIPVIDPVVTTGREGTVVELHPVLCGEGNTLLLESRWQMGRLEELIERETVHGILQLPLFDHLGTNSQTLVRDGGIVMLGGIKTDRFNLADFKDPRLVMMVRVRLGEDPTEETQPEAQKPLRTLRLYNVALLTLRRPSFPNPLPKETTTRGGGGAGSFDFGEPDPGDQIYSSEALVGLVRNNLSPDSWEHRENRIEPLGESELLVVQTEGVHAQIESFLSTLRREAGTLVNVELWQFTMNPTLYRQLIVDGEQTPDGAYLVPDETLDELMSNAGKGSTLDRWFTLSGRSGQTMTLAEDRRRSIIEKYWNASGGTGQVVESVTDPIVGVARGGLRLQARGKVLPDQRNVMLDLEMQTSTVATPMTAVKTQWGPIEMPRSSQQRQRLNLTVPLDRLLLVGAASTSRGQGVILVRVRQQNLFED